MQNYFKHVRQLIAKHQFEKLKELQIFRPDFFNWASEIFEGIHVQEQPQREALIWTDGSNEERYTFKEIAVKGNQLLNFFRNNGVDQGDCMFLQLPLLPENWVSYFSAIKGGFVVVPAATTLGVRDILFRFETLLPKLVIADAHNAAKIDEAEELLGKKINLKIIVRGERDGWLSFASIDQEPQTARAANTLSNDVLFLFFTSGTTGMPKVVSHTHLTYPFGHLTTAAWIGLLQDDIHYNIAQPGWAKYAWSCFFAPWSIGSTVFAFNQSGKFNTNQQFELMSQYRVTTFCAPPTALRMLIMENMKEHSFRFRECVAAGEPLNPEIIEAWKKGTGITMRDGYGQTESTAMIVNLPGQAIKYGSMGRPTFLYDVIIADDEGNELPAHEEGHIAVKSNSEKPDGIFLDYFGDPEKKKEVFKNGLYYSGDKAYKDEDGYIWFIGRNDDVIKSSDYRVGPFEVESVLIEHAAIVESAVVGSPHPIRGNLVKAFIILKPDTVAGPELAKKIFSFCKKNLASYKLPRIIEFVEELPKTISGKIRRVELRAMEAAKKAKKEEGALEYFYE